MRSCPRDIHMKILRGMECSDGEYTPLIYRPWFMITLGVLWFVFLIILACCE